jgi:2-haloacid dehalogenase
MDAPTVKALIFDVFGTVVDWRGSVIREGEELGRKKNLDVDWAAFADEWRGRYAPSMDRVRRGDHLNKVWHRLDPWPDSVAGLSRLKERYVISTISNGNVALLTNMAKRAGLPWDLILSAELVRHYKPDPEAYLMAPNLLDLRPDEVMLVAAHLSDLRAAQTHGLRTAYVLRPLEWGPEGEAEPADQSSDLVVEDLTELAEKLDA